MGLGNLTRRISLELRSSLFGNAAGTGEGWPVDEQDRLEVGGMTVGPVLHPDVALKNEMNALYSRAFPP